MTRKEYRKRKVAMKVWRTHNKTFSVQSAYTQCEAFEKVLRALGPLDVKSKIKVLKCMEILFS